MTVPRLHASRRRQLERQLREAPDARVYQRTLALLRFDAGGTVAEVADLLRVSRQTVYNWIAAYRRDFDPADLADSPRPGRPRLWTDDLAGEVRALLADAPQALGYFAAHWSVPLLVDALADRTGRAYHPALVRRGLRSLGYVWRRARYVLAPDPEAEKKTPHPPAGRPAGAAGRAAG